MLDAAAAWARLGAGDLLVQFGVPRAVGGKIRRCAACFGGAFLRQGGFQGGVLGRGVAALGRQHGDLLLGLGEFTFERREGGLRRLAGVLRGLLGLGHVQGGRCGRGGGRMLGAAADGARDAGLQLGSEFGRGVGQPFLAEIEPALAPVLVLRPGAAVAFGDGSAVLLGRGVAPDQDQQFLGGGGLLRPQLHLGGEFFERTQRGEQGTRIPGAGRDRAAAPDVRSVFQLRQAQAKLGAAAPESGEPGLIGQPFLQHRAQ